MEKDSRYLKVTRTGEIDEADLTDTLKAKEYEVECMAKSGIVLVTFDTANTVLRALGVAADKICSHQNALSEKIAGISDDSEVFEIAKNYAYDEGLLAD